VAITSWIPDTSVGTSILTGIRASVYGVLPYLLTKKDPISAVETM
jgi:hypothetical protein